MLQSRAAPVIALLRATVVLSMVCCGGLSVHGTYLQRLCVSASHCVCSIGMTQAYKEPKAAVGRLLRTSEMV